MWNSRRSVRRPSVKFCSNAAHRGASATRLSPSAGARRTGVDRLLRGLHRDPALARDDLPERDGLADDLALALADDAADDAPALGLGGGERAAAEDELHRARLADGVREPLRAAAAGDRAEIDLGLAKGRGWGGEDDVGRERELAAAAELVRVCEWECESEW